MTDLTVAGVDMAPNDSRDAAEMQVILIGLSIDASQIMRVRLWLIERRDGWCRAGAAHREEAGAPIRTPPEMVMNLCFDLSELDPGFRTIG